MNKSNNLYKDIVTGLFFTVGIFSFMSGQFVLSTMLFGAASLFSNLNVAKPIRI
ncbi:hypothetical protein [Methylomonas albis]|uniref:YrhK domain-containing protein n=1 Tax=Methylomonas albis TaxID=1854563 RepID=A0ABR9CY80_9GAMM|nr:hypothetical protein [Methylomonas albis]MBD9355476.1 hypothetical protein [Methylomonas albis]